MKWLYKIWGGYDGFRPSQIAARMLPGDELNLGWAKYADVAEPGDDVWVWFHEGNRFTPGVYVKGIVASIDPVAQQLVLRTQEWDASHPLTTPDENAVLAAVVAPRNRQVFVLPEDFRRFDLCTAHLPGASSCAARLCDHCTHWASLPQIRPTHVYMPELIEDDYSAFAPAYWVVANRSYGWNNTYRLRAGITATTQMFYRFKTGEAELAYPLAKGMVAALAKRRLLEADAIVPVPLSPEKIAAKEIHRTLLLSESLSRLIQVPVIDGLALMAPKGKRASQNAGESPAQFREDYSALLAVSPDLASLERIIIVDDVCTRGNTLAAVGTALRSAGVDAELVAATAGQMTVQRAVADDRALFRPSVTEMAN
ncbi:ComF family protein [Geodermatophilus sp. SYSU D01062]